MPILNIQVCIALLGAVVATVAFAVENPLEWEFRLAGGTTGLNGRVEMRPNSTAPWGTICKDIFKENSFGAIAACNSAGLVGVTQAVYKSSYGPGTGPIYLTNVACSSSNTFIQNCTRSALEQVNCVHYEDAGVECSPPEHLWQFKMFNGTAPSNGVVMLKPMPSLPWGSVFLGGGYYDGDGFERNRIVMCRTLGYNTTRTIALRSLSLGFPNPIDVVPSWLYSQTCATSTIARIGLCGFYQIGYYRWEGRDALALDCDPPLPKLVGPVTVKLINGVTPWSGMIWISPNNSAPWYGIAAHDVTSFPDDVPMMTTAQTPAQQSLLRAVCASAGFPNATNPVYGKYGFVAPPLDAYSYTNLIGMNFTCSDSVGTNLSDCFAGPDIFTSSREVKYYAGVDCFPTAYNFSQWEFRLFGGTATAGRADLRPSSSAPWLSVAKADPGFTSSGLLWTALCRQMGFNTSNGMLSQTVSPISTWSSQYYLGSAKAPFCPSVGNLGKRLADGANLQNCTLSPIGNHNCFSNKDLFLDCAFPSWWEAELRLVNGPSPAAGRLEMRPSASYPWGTYASPFGDNMNVLSVAYNAIRICQTLGFTNVTNPIATMAYGYGSFSQPVWWAYAECTSSDTDFRNCSSLYTFGNPGTYAGYHYNDMGVNCYPPPFTPVVKMEGGGAPWKGRIMYQYSPNIPSGSVCNDYFKNNHFSWNAACRSAGFLNVTRAMYVHYGPAASHLPINLDDISCNPNDLFLENCTHRPFGQHNCHHGEDAGVDCYPPPEVTAPWQFRLADGTAATNGRVEMRPSPTHAWGSICAGPYYNHSVAAWEAACRSVGIANPPRARWRYFGKGPDTVYLDNVSCTMDNMTLVDCDRFPLGSYRCSPSEVAGVDCDAPLETPQQWQFRLVDGWTATSGRLEMRPDSATAWGGVCRHGLQHGDALRTVCRSTGHAAATRPLLFRPPGRAMPLAQPFYLDDATCNTTTPYLSNCSYAPLYAHDCDPQWDALFVECMPTLTAAATPTASASQTPTPTATVKDLPTRTASTSAVASNTKTGLSTKTNSSRLSGTWTPTPTNPADTPTASPSPTSARSHTATVQQTPTGGWPKAPHTATMNATVTATTTVNASATSSLRPPRTQTIPHHTTETPSVTMSLLPAAHPPPTTTASPSHTPTVLVVPAANGTADAVCTALAAGSSGVIEAMTTVVALRGRLVFDARLPAPVLRASVSEAVDVLFARPSQTAIPAGLLDVGTGIECRPSSPDMLRCTLTILDEKALTAAVIVPLVLPTSLLASGCTGGVEVRISLMLLPAASGDALLAAASSFATSAAVSAPFAFLADPTAFDSMAVVVALLSRCASVTDTARARWARYLLSPLIDLGPAVVGLIHTLAPVAILLSHAIIVFASARLENDDETPTHLSKESNTQASPTLAAASRWRFPAASMAVAVLLYPGAAWALTAHIRDVSAGAPAMVWLMVLLCVFLVAVPVGAAFCLIRVDVCATFTAYPAPEHRSDGRAKAALRWACVSRGVWGPGASWRSFGLLHGLSAGRRPVARWALVPGACAVLLLVCALIGAPARMDTCRGAHAAAAVVVFVGTAALALAATGTFATPLTAALTIVGGLSLGALLAAQAAETSDTADAVKAAAVLTNAAAGILRAINAAGLWFHRCRSPPLNAAPEESIGLDMLQCPQDAILNDISSEQHPSVAVDVL